MKICPKCKYINTNDERCEKCDTVLVSVNTVGIKSRN